MPKQIDIQDLNLGQEVWTPQQGEAAQQQIQAALAEANLPAEKLVEIGQWAQRVIQDPSQFSEFQSWLRSQGLSEEDIPQQADFQELAAMAAVGSIAAQQAPVNPVEPTAPATAAGPISPDQLQSMAGQGRMGDTMLAHINPQEAAVLESMGGVGTINPATGLPEYGFFSDLWKGVKKVVKQVAPFVLPVMALIPGLQPLIPALGAALGASAAFAPIVGAAVISGGVTALSGGSLKEVLTSAAMTGLGAYLTPIVGNYVGGLAGITNPVLTSAIGSATLAGGMTALRGGTVSQILTAAATGAAANYLGTTFSNMINSGAITNTRITQGVAEDALFAAADAKGMRDAGLGEYQITKILTDTGLEPSVASVAAKEAVAGRTAEEIGVTLSNRFAGVKATGSTDASLYKNGVNGATSSVVGGANAKVLETVQKYEDGLIAANEAKGILDQARSEGLTSRTDLTRRVVSEMTTRGVSADAASRMADSLISNSSVGSVASTMAEQYGSAKLFGTPNMMYKDADFIAQQIKDLRTQGLSSTQIINTLTQEGINEQAVRVGLQYSNYDAASIADNITKYAQTNQLTNLIAAPANNVAPPTTSTPVEPTPAPAPAPTTQPPPDTIQSGPVAPPPPAEPVPPQIGGNVSEAEFIAADAAQLAQTLNNNTAAVQQALTYSGVDPVAAAQAANMAVMGATIPEISQAIAQPLPSTVPTGSTANLTNPSDVVAVAKANPDVITNGNYTINGQQMEITGISQDAVYVRAADGTSYKMNADGTMAVRAPGQVSFTPTTTVSSPAATTPAAPMAPTTTTPAPAPAPAPSQGTRSWNPVSSGRPGTELGYVTTDAAGRQIWTSDDGTLSYGRGNAGWDRTPLFDLTGNQPTQLQPGSTPGGNVSEAEFIAADAAQLAAQTNNNAAAVQQNLTYAGVDPVIAAQAANMAVSGATIPQITQAIAGDVNQPAPGTTAPAPSTGNQPQLGGGITAENIPASSDTNLVGQTPTAPGFQPGDLGTGITEPVYPNLPEMGGGQGLIVPGVTPEITTPVLTPEPPPLTDAQIGAIVATPTIPDPTAPMPTPGRPNMGTFTPAPPDPSWSQALQYPGVNPGLVGAAVRPAYETTSPVQSQYYWGRQPYFAYTDDLANYNQVAMPTTPFGIQQGYFEQPLALPQIPVYGENMFVMPQTQPQQFQAFAAPQAQTAQALYPQQLFPIAPQMPVGSPNYIYDIRPTAGQYSVPA
jgi:hypothetical protein